MSALTPESIQASSLGREAFASLISVPPSVLSTNVRPWTYTFTVDTSGRVLSNNLKLSVDRRYYDGFVNANIVGPLTIKVVPKYGVSTATPMATVTVALTDSTWGAPEDSLWVARIPDSVVLGVGAMASTAMAELPIPDIIKTNIKVFQNIGVEGLLVVTAEFIGFAEVNVIISGRVQLDGVLPVRPWDPPVQRAARAAATT
ncbi:hypothetical protein [Salmonella sp. NW1113]|uniref:hypothetical protein n=1 Tax=unclassified Salmonella TaxID=2614656 RepID=UPI003F42F380